MLRCIAFLMGVCLCMCFFADNRINNNDVSGAIGEIYISEINVELPIYSGTDDEVLAEGIGHIPWSSPLGGGENTHCLLAGHRGLPGKQLFLRLNELEKGDLFSVVVDNRTLTYEVCNIQVIKPEETEKLGIQSGRDLVSLITCTPYGINTHRLVVTGERV